MNIVYKDSETKIQTCSISTITEGSLFRFKSDLFIKVEEIVDNVTQDSYNAVSLTTGEFWVISDNDIIFIYTGDVIIDPSKFQNYF